MAIIGNLPVTFCRNVTWLRKRYYLSRRALAALTGLSEYTLTCMEKREQPLEMPFETLERLSGIFDVSVEDLVHTDLQK